MKEKIEIDKKTYIVTQLMSSFVTNIDKIDEDNVDFYIKTSFMIADKIIEYRNNAKRRV